MMKTRVIPCLLLRDGSLVKGVKFNDLSYVGDPINAMRIFNGKEVDEIALFEVGASRASRGPDFDLISDIVGEAYMPVAYGGGIATLDQALRILELGVEKVVLNTILSRAPDLIDALAVRSGSQSVVASIDVRRSLFKHDQVVVANGTRALSRRAVEYAVEMESRGAGELLVTSIDRDGTGVGYDLDLIRAVSDAVQIPVIACGGAGKIEDFAEAVGAGASAVAAGSMFVYHGPHKAVLVSYPARDVLERVLA